MKSSAINRGEIEVPEKGWFIHTHFVQRVKIIQIEIRTWNKYIHMHKHTYYIDTFYIYNIHTYIHLEQARQGSCPEFRPFKMFHVFQTHTHIYIFIPMCASVCIFVYFRCFSLLYLAAFCFDRQRCVWVIFNGDIDENLQNKSKSI